MTRFALGSIYNEKKWDWAGLLKDLQLAHDNLQGGAASGSGSGVPAVADHDKDDDDLVAVASRMSLG